jgi:fluoride exporter
LRNFLLVGLAGAIGSLLRFLLGSTVHFLWPYLFPLGTLLVNLIGCFLLGWMSTFLFQSNKLHPSTKAALGTGLIGSFTTFSTFSVEAIELIKHSEWFTALLYMVISMTGGLIMSWAGFKTGSYQWKRQQSVVEDDV